MIERKKSIYELKIRGIKTVFNLLFKTADLLMFISDSSYFVT